MDMQGKPIGNTGEGTKNTSVPAPPVQEGPGAIAKDSLAAESSAYPDKYTSSVLGGNSTFNNTDTSGAKTLPPASDAQERLEPTQKDNYAGVGGKKYPEEAGGADFGDSKFSDQGYVGGPGKATSSTGSGSDSSKADPAPTYVSNMYTHNTKPKGSNIKEGGFDADAPNASFNTDIGTENDPGREATAHFQRQFQGDAADAGMPKTQKGLDTDTPYQALETEQSL